jgi:hypothetical protein
VKCDSCMWLQLIWCTVLTLYGWLPLQYSHSSGKILGALMKERIAEIMNKMNLLLVLCLNEVNQNR